MMQPNVNYVWQKTALVAMMTLALTACGGSSSHDDPPVTPPDDPSVTPPTSSTTKLQVRALDGYLSNALVFADYNNNLQRDKDEPSARTDSQGLVTLEIDTSKLTSPILKLYGYVNKTTTTNITLDAESTLQNSVLLSSTVFVRNGEIDNTNIHPINPFTTLASNNINVADNISVDTYQKTYQATLNLVLNNLGLDAKVSEVIDQDYNDPAVAKTNDAMLSALITGEYLVNQGLLPHSFQDVVNSWNNFEITADGEVSTAVQDALQDLKQWKYPLQATLHNVKKAIANNQSGNIVADAIKNTTDKINRTFRSLSGQSADDYRCAISYGNNVYCWGNNYAGMLGNPATFSTNGKNGYEIADLYSEKQVLVVLEDGQTPLENAKQVVTGNAHACALTYDGSVYCWGLNDHGQLGKGSIDKDKFAAGTEAYPYAIQVVKGQQSNDRSPYLAHVKSLAIGHDSTCAVTYAGEVYCWGSNTSLQLGAEYPQDDNHELWANTTFANNVTLDGFVKGVAFPVKVAMPNTVAKVNKVIGGVWSYCALANNVDPNDHHNLYCWGNDTIGLVSQNWQQYQNKIKQNFMTMTYKDGTPIEDIVNQPEAWTVFTADSSHRYALFGAPVQQVTEFNSYSTRLLTIDSPEKIQGSPSTLKDWLDIVNEEDKLSLQIRYDKLCSSTYATCTFTAKEEPRLQVRIVKKVADNEDGGSVSATYFTEDDLDTLVKTIPQNGASSEAWLNWSKEYVPDLYEEYNERCVNPDDNCTFTSTSDRVTTLNLASKIDVTNVTDFGIINFDSETLFVLNNDSVVYTTTLEDQGYQIEQVLHSANTKDQPIQQIFANVVGNVSFALTEDEVAYAMAGDGNGMVGNGDSEIDEGYIFNNPPTAPFVVQPTSDDNSKALTNLVALSVNKRSVCALQQRLDEQQQFSNKLYCWGSSLFGQLGKKTDMDNLSFKTVNEAWLDYSDENVYYDDSSAVEALPQEITYPEAK